MMPTIRLMREPCDNASSHVQSEAEAQSDHQVCNEIWASDANDHCTNYVCCSKSLAAGCKLLSLSREGNELKFVVLVTSMFKVLGCAQLTLLHEEIELHRVISN
jgi:hypothetical protein